MSDHDQEPSLSRSVVREGPWVKRLWRAAQGLVAGAIAAVPLVATLIAVVPHDSSMLVFAPLAHLLALGAAFSGMTSLWLRRRRPDWSKLEEVAASEEGLRLADGTFVPRKDLLEATITARDGALGGFGSWLVPWMRRLLQPGGSQPDIYEVELKQPGRLAYPLRVSARTLNDARAIVEALGLDASRRAVTRKVMSPSMQPRVTIAALVGMMTAMFTGAVLVGATQSPYFAVIALLGVLGMMGLQLLGLVKTKVTIGADAVTVSWLGRAQTILLTEITGVEIIPRATFTPAKVLLLRGTREPFEILVGIRGNNPFEPFSVEEECNRLSERIHEAMSKGGNVEPTEFRFWAQRREALPIDKWVAILRGVVDGYREGQALPFTVSELWDVLRNVRATELERTAAAVALSTQADDRTRERLADVAASTGLPRLRIALDAAAKGDSTVLVESLTTLCAKETKSGAPRVRIEVQGDEPEVDEEASSKDEAAKRASR